MGIKKIISAAVVAAGLGLGTLAAAPVASADEASFINDLNANGFVESSPGVWLSLGYAACNIGNLEDATNYIFWNSGDSVSADAAQFVAESAFMFLC